MPPGATNVPTPARYGPGVFSGSVLRLVHRPAVTDAPLSRPILEERPVERVVRRLPGFEDTLDVIDVAAALSEELVDDARFRGGEAYREVEDRGPSRADDHRLLEIGLGNENVNACRRCLHGM